MSPCMEFTTFLCEYLVRQQPEEGQRRDVLPVFVAKRALQYHTMHLLYHTFIASFPKDTQRVTRLDPVLRVILSTNSSKNALSLSVKIINRDPSHLYRSHTSIPTGGILSNGRNLGTNYLTSHFAASRFLFACYTLS